ncbi:hypothetical protein [Roseomonas genomospecies 6]|uniref:Uncharacterized protein n=1 Tax=Roseomonas genomospecies 6 TaxID=214106 RepID=A0A9W7KN85_9PROT|nr:hypothetical protein [Roseomonas genomospecies 6]KAA0675887.1 hypothetical protein DS843_29585 [Roseomonas genomospecies 6]
MNTIAKPYFGQYSWSKRLPHYYCSARRSVERWIDLHSRGVPSGISIHRGDGDYQLTAPDPFFGSLTVREDALCRTEVFRYNALHDWDVVQRAIHLVRREIKRPERVLAALVLLRSEVEVARDYVRRKRLPSRTQEAVLDFAQRNELTVTMHHRAALARVFTRSGQTP